MSLTIQKVCENIESFFLRYGFKRYEDGQLKYFIILNNKDRLYYEILDTTLDVSPDGKQTINLSWWLYGGRSRWLYGGRSHPGAKYAYSIEYTTILVDDNFKSLNKHLMSRIDLKDIIRRHRLNELGI